MQLIYADAPNQDFDLTAAPEVTILSLLISGLSDRGQLLIDLWWTVLTVTSNSTYTQKATFGTLVNTLVGGLNGNSAVNRQITRSRHRLAFTAGSGYAVFHSIGIAPTVPADTFGQMINTMTPAGWSTVANPALGSGNLTVTMASSSLTGTKRLTLVAYTVRGDASPGITVELGVGGRRRKKQPRARRRDLGLLPEEIARQQRQEQRYLEELDRKGRARPQLLQVDDTTAAEEASTVNQVTSDAIVEQAKAHAAQAEQEILARQRARHRKTLVLLIS